MAVLLQKAQISFGALHWNEKKFIRTVYNIEIDIGQESVLKIIM